MEGRERVFVLFLSLTLALGFAANFLLAPVLSIGNYEEGFARLACKLIAFVVVAIYAYHRSFGLKQIAACLMAVTFPTIVAQVAGFEMPQLILHSLNGLTDCLSVVAVGMTVFLMPARELRSGIMLGFALSVLLVVAARTVADPSTEQLRVVFEVTYLAALLVVAFAYRDKGSFAPAGETVGKYGGPGRFLVLIASERGSLLLMLLVSTLLSFVLGMFSSYAQVEGLRSGFSDGALYLAFASLVALFIFALWQPTSRWFYSMFTALMLACVLALLVVILHPPSTRLISGGFGLMSMLVSACACTYTIEFSKEQGVTPAFTCITLPFMVNVIFDFGMSVNLLYYQFAAAGTYDIARVAAVSLALIAVASLAMLAVVASKSENERFSAEQHESDAGKREGAATLARGPRGAADDAVVEEGAGEGGIGDVLLSRYGLTPREAEIVILFASGRSARHISERDVVSESTVKTHLKHAYTKLSVHNRQELIDFIARLR